eukprot:scaffold129596_cov33-Tisochrysis_lutea.AAC.1
MVSSLLLRRRHRAKPAHHSRIITHLALADKAMARRDSAQHCPHPALGIGINTALLGVAPHQSVRG